MRDASVNTLKLTENGLGRWKTVLSWISQVILTLLFSVLILTSFYILIAMYHIESLTIIAGLAFILTLLFIKAGLGVLDILLSVFISIAIYKLLTYLEQRCGVGN